MGTTTFMAMNSVDQSWADRVELAVLLAPSDVCRARARSELDQRPSMHGSTHGKLRACGKTIWQDLTILIPKMLLKPVLMHSLTSQ